MCKTFSIQFMKKSRTFTLKDVNDGSTFQLATNKNREVFGRNHLRRTGYCAKCPNSCPGRVLEVFLG